MEHLRDQRIWVTGAGGFVGGHLLPRLRAAGAEVLPTDHDVDVREAAPLAAALGRLRPDAVIHLAARSSVAASLGERRETWETNYLGVRHLLRAAVERAPQTRILLVGSGVVYGSARPGAPPFAESAPLRPGSPYAWTKACADLLGARHAARGLAVVRARPFNHTGPGQSPVFVAASFARQIAEIEAGRREPVLRVGNLESVRDFLAVEDVVEAYLRLLDPGVPPAAYNVARGRGVRIGDLLEMLLDEARVRPRVEPDEARWRPTDVAVGSAERLHETTGWAPRRPLAASLRALLDAARDEVSASQERGSGFSR